MANHIKLDIQETAEELRNLLKKETNTQKKERLHALYLLKSGQVTTLEALSKLLVRDTSTIYRWFQKYKTEGLTGFLKLYIPAGRPLTIPPEALEQLKQKVQEPEAFKTYGEIQLWLKANCGVDVDYYVVYRTVRYQLKAKMKAPRNSKKSSLRDTSRDSEMALPSSNTKPLKSANNTYNTSGEQSMRFVPASPSSQGFV